MWDLPGSGIEPMTAALAGGFFTTEPPGKPLKSFEIENAHYKKVVLICTHFFTPLLISSIFLIYARYFVVLT